MSEKTKDIYIELNDGDRVLGAYVILESKSYDSSAKLDDSKLTGSMFCIGMHKVKLMLQNYNKQLAKSAKSVPTEIFALRFLEALPYVVSTKVFSPEKTSMTKHMVEEYDSKYGVKNFEDPYAIIALDNDSINMYRTRSRYYIAVNINANLITTRGFVNLLAKKELCKLRGVKDISKLASIKEEWKNPIMHFKFNEIEEVVDYINNNSDGFTFKDYFVAIN